MRPVKWLENQFRIEKNYGKEKMGKLHTFTSGNKGITGDTVDYLYEKRKRTPEIKLPSKLPSFGCLALNHQ
jgi:hypothetical protein